MISSNNIFPDLSSIQGFILDLDGVVWRADQPIGDLPRVFEIFRDQGWKVVLATNNATLSPDLYVQKFADFGVKVERRQVVNSAQAAAHYLHGQFPSGGPVFILGEAGLIEALKEQNFFHAEENVLAVVVGMDRQLTYDKLSRAALLIRSGALFVGTNPDRTFPMPFGLVPGAGAILAALETATDIKPFIAGKPAQEMYKVALERLGLTPGETLVVGDRLETDIAGAQALHCRTALVLSGVTSEQAALSWAPPPDVIAPDLTEVLLKVAAQRSF